MPDPAPGVAAPAAPAPAAAQPATPAPKPTGQQAAAPVPAAAKPAVPATPAPQAGAPAQVPLASLMEEREKRQALQAEVESLKSTVAQIQRPQPVAAPVQNNEELRARMDKLWNEDPRKAVQAEIAMATQWSDNVNAQVDGEAAQLAGKYKDFNDYRDTAMRYVRALPLEQRARPGIVEMAFLVSRGQGVDQIIEKAVEAQRQAFLANPAAFQMPAGSSAGSQLPAAGPQPTEAESRAAKAMKIPIEEYMKHKK